MNRVHAADVHVHRRGSSTDTYHDATLMKVEEGYLQIYDGHSVFPVAVYTPGSWEYAERDEIRVTEKEDG